jgi:hypothetical protein
VSGLLFGYAVAALITFGICEMYRARARARIWQNIASAVLWPAFWYFTLRVAAKGAA